MLTITRRIDQGIVIVGRGIRIVPINIGTKHVRLGIKADPNIPILRGELVGQEEAQLRKNSGKGMLVLARITGQTVMIDNEIEIKVLEIVKGDGNKSTNEVELEIIAQEGTIILPEELVNPTSPEGQSPIGRRL